MLRAVIFDMDGVLVDTEPLYARIAVRTGQECNIPITPEDNNRFIGSTVTHMYRTLIKEYGVNVSLEHVLQTNFRIKRQMFEEEKFLPIPGVKELIKDLYKQGIKLAIASSSSKHTIDVITKTLGIQKYFSKLISGSCLEHPKPAPDIFLIALKELGIDAGEAVIIEDSANGLRAAKAANIASIGYINPNSGNQDLSEACVLTDSFEGMNCQYVDDVLKRANGEPITIARTKRLLIRELTVEDIKVMYKIYQDEDVRKYIENMDEYLDIEIEKHKAYIKNVYGFYGYGLWGVYSLDTMDLIGRCGIQNTVIDGSPQIELSYLLDKAYWGMGYAIECTTAVLEYAATVLGIGRIVAVIDKFNKRSLKLASRIGMSLEKDIDYHGRKCSLYSISNIEESLKRRQVSNRVRRINDAAPDTSVYGKRYQKQEEFNNG